MSKPQDENRRDFSEEFTKISGHARDEILWVRSVYKLVFSGVIALIAVGIYFTYQNTHDLKADMQKDADTMRANLHADFETLKQQQQQDFNTYLAQMHDEVTKRIDDEFANSNIVALVHDQAKERIDAIADLLIQTNIQNKIIPIRDDFLQQLSQSKDEIQKRLEKLDADSQQTHQTETNIEQTLAETRTLLAKSDEQSTFIITAIQAQNDNRKAFETIMTWANDPSYPFHDDAAKIAVSIATSYAPSIAPKSYPVVKWDVIGLDPNIFSMVRFKEIWNSFPSVSARSLLDSLWSNTNIDKNEKLVFVHSVLASDSRNSLQTQDHAAHILADELNAKYDFPFRFNDIEQKWNERLKTNQVPAIAGTNSLNQSY